MIEIDFLAGVCSEGSPSEMLARAAKVFASQALPKLCADEGIAVSEFTTLIARFGGTRATPWCAVTVESSGGRRHTDRYEGIPLRRVRVLDSLGRPRAQRG